MQARCTPAYLLNAPNGAAWCCTRGYSLGAPNGAAWRCTRGYLLGAPNGATWYITRGYSLTLLTELRHCKVDEGDEVDEGECVKKGCEDFVV
ncbi:MAG: hypothetical protein II592_05750 [Muribaculaceae bacterium]|nr:hypothetical protein [Muribaculaceae bacterium]